MKTPSPVNHVNWKSVMERYFAFLDLVCERSKEELVHFGERLHTQGLESAKARLEETGFFQGMMASFRGLSVLFPFGFIAFLQEVLLSSLRRVASDSGLGEAEKIRMQYYLALTNRILECMQAEPSASSPTASLVYVDWLKRALGSLKELYEQQVREGAQGSHLLVKAQTEQTEIFVCDELEDNVMMSLKEHYPHYNPLFQVDKLRASPLQLGEAVSDDPASIFDLATVKFYEHLSELSTQLTASASKITLKRVLLDIIDAYENFFHTLSAACLDSLRQVVRGLDERVYAALDDCGYASLCGPLFTRLSEAVRRALSRMDDSQFFVLGLLRQQSGALVILNSSRGEEYGLYSTLYVTLFRVLTNSPMSKYDHWIDKNRKKLTAYLRSPQAGCPARLPSAHLEVSKKEAVRPTSCPHGSILRQRTTSLRLQQIGSRASCQNLIQRSNSAIGKDDLQNLILHENMRENGSILDSIGRIGVAMNRLNDDRGRAYNRFAMWLKLTVIGFVLLKYVFRPRHERLMRERRELWVDKREEMLESLRMSRIMRNNPHRLFVKARDEMANKGAYTKHRFEILSRGKETHSQRSIRTLFNGEIESQRALVQNHSQREPVFSS